jgi:DNA (cytosine-5)-methyltransferase 1
MKHGSLFSGIGGFDLAAEWMGWENVFHCEWNDFGQKVLHHYWPKAISYHDITKTDFTIHRGNIDILTGGFPCQPYSSAGKRKGKEDERHLWPEMLRAIREIQPRWVVGENVLGLVNWSGGLVFHEVQADLETEGYEVWPYVLPAVSVNAPHRRDRVWFVAYAKLYANGLRTERWMDLGGELLERPKREEKTNGLNNISKNEWLTPHPNGNGLNQRNGNEYGDVADTGHTGLQRSKVNGSIGGSGKESDKFTSGCVRSNWQNFPTQSPVRFGDDGLSSRLDGITFSKWRNESIKAAGNAIVPQVVLMIFKAIEQYENINK